MLATRPPIDLPPMISGVVASSAVIATGIASPLAPHLVVWTEGVLVGGVLLAVLNMHLYDKRIRYALAALGISGAFLWGIGGFWVGSVGIGLTLAAVSGYALKEQFCFRVPGLRLVPVMLAGSVLTRVLGIPIATAVLMSIAGVLLVVLCVAKLRMPLHFDVGDKSKYQI